MIPVDDQLFDTKAMVAAPTTLAGRFGVPPVSVLDASGSAWQARKRAWLGMGIRSEAGRDAALCFGEMNGEERTSVFDPVLCELAYRWWSPSGGWVLDPFAGGSVRGIVAGAMGRHYVGIELRAEQVEANRAQAEEMGPALEVTPRWTCGDAGTAPMPEAVDLVFSCPPYGSLERYSNDPRDLSAMTTGEFAAAYRRIIGRAVERLASDRFAVFVVGNYRDTRGRLVNLEGLTVDAFAEAGCDWYNDIILRTASATVEARVAGKVSGFEVSRKIGRTHQYVMVFVKGDWRRAVEACGPIAGLS